jgi:hypothetical protein
MNTYQEHYAHALATLRKGEDDMWYTTPEAMRTLRQHWNQVGLSGSRQDRLTREIYRVIAVRNEIQRDVDAGQIEQGTVLGYF